MRIGTRLIVLGMATVMLTATASEMTVAQFLQAAKKAESLGPAAILSSDVRALRTETQRVRDLYIADITKQKKAGGAQHSCPPADNRPKMTGDELRDYLTSLSPAAQKQPFRVAVYNLMKKKYPCKKG
ncbi:hypothetical protein [Blastomonas sp. AAP53]|uniref:hypothetical protein n=1 Tax=Blastomonas sp. AAP53 TaxID=1248760 RepID=UPI0012670EB6|nr:hypothetical protein [Blastomonas sp. AAP53]